MQRFLSRLVILCLMNAPALAGWGDFDYDFDADNKPWKEVQAQLPAYPKLEEALPFFVSSASDNEFFIDPKSVSVGEDDTVRYTLIIKSVTGVLNVSFEGIRCGTREKKLYAFGRQDGAWSRNKYAKWEAVKYKDVNRQHHMLYDDFFCPNTLIAKDAAEAVNALKSGIHPRAVRQ
ncbi:MAG: CNP1-like family protein [Hydrogenophilales bacterium]|nr:CNP1-like family protein [Hydrogenophilales bacterium]